MKIHNVQSPNFGMALRITPEAAKALSTATIEQLKTIEKIGKELADTCEVDLEIGKNLTPRVNTIYISSYLPPFKFQKPKDDFLHFTTTWDGMNLGGKLQKGNPYTSCLKFATKEEALKAYEKIQNAKTDLEKGAEFTKLISDVVKLKTSNREAFKLQDKEKMNLIADLLHKFSGEADIK